VTETTTREEALRRLDKYEADEKRRVTEMNAISAQFGYRPKVTVYQSVNLLSLAEGARIAGVALETFQTQRRRGRLQCRKVGRDWMLTTDELRRYLLESRESPGRRPRVPEQA
jgi:hypothetical protein